MVPEKGRYCPCRIFQLGYALPMSSIDDLVSRWITASVIDEQVAMRIRAFESVEAERNRNVHDNRPGLLEAIAYLGIAVVAVGVLIMVTVSWEDLRDWARVLVTAVPGVLALVLGQALRQTGRPGLVRGGHMAWLAAVALLGGSVAITGSNADWNEEDIALAGGLAAAFVAIVLWVFAASHPQVVAIGASMFAVAMALGARSDDFSNAVAGLSLVVLATAGVVLAERRALVPTLTARCVSAFGVGVGAFFAGFESGAYEPLAFVAAAALVALSIRRSVLVYMLVGVALVFVGLVSSITRHADDPTTAAAGLIVVGTLLVGAVLVLARWQPWERRTT